MTKHFSEHSEQPTQTATPKKAAVPPLHLVKNEQGEHEFDLWDFRLPESEYVRAEQTKNQIVLHHTAGSHRADWTIQGWDSDQRGRVATAFVVGGRSTVDANAEWNGRVVQAFKASHWAWHLGGDTGERLNKGSIGIELCNYGYAVRDRTGNFWSYVKRPIPREEVTDLGFEWRGYRFWHSYTDEQIEATRKLLVFLSQKFNIPLKKQWSAADFNVSRDALSGLSGLWTHSQFRKDKFDCYPHPNLIQMLNEL